MVYHVSNGSITSNLDLQTIPKAMSPQYIRFQVGCCRTHPWILKADSKTAAVQRMFIYLITHVNTAKRQLDTHQPVRDLVLIWALWALPMLAHGGRVETEEKQERGNSVGCQNVNRTVGALPFPGQTGFPFPPASGGIPGTFWRRVVSILLLGRLFTGLHSGVVLWAGCLIFMRVPGVKQLYNLGLAHQLQGSTNTIK